MFKLKSVTLRITTPRQAWGALRIPELPEKSKLGLLEFLADSGDVKYARLVMDADLCRDLCEDRKLLHRFHCVLIDHRDPWWVARIFRIGHYPKRRTELLGIIETLSRAAKYVLEDSISKLSPEEQLRLAPVALRSDPMLYWAKRLLRKHSGTAPALRAYLIGFRGITSGQKRDASNYAMALLGSRREEYFPASAPLTVDEQEILIQTIRANGYGCTEALRNYRRREMQLTGEEIKLFIEGALVHFSSSSHFDDQSHIRELLADEKLRPHFTEEQLAQLQKIAETRKAA